MSINWVMLHEHEGFVRLPHEHLIYTSPPRTCLSLKPLDSYKGKDAISFQSDSGRIYLTNHRVVYIPAKKSNDFQSFSAPLLHMHDTHVSAPLFGANVWQSLVQPVPGGGIPSSLPAAQLKVTFKEGGAFDYHNKFEEIKERLRVAHENTRQSSRGVGNVDMSTVHLDQLPAYSGPVHDSTGSNRDNQHPPSNSQDSHATSESCPMGPPPGYEEVQQQSIADELEERLRRAS
ncbi:hypothetical protein BDV38DRAFT_261414 [Aspergillus pseudotamarii]|uniref:GRAM domain-containing protein n=1 Tax=Aspergillus pseudotamarii TaxID=132259 RepID=A0A5N6SG25_ASPPS|nr:uncharacterized protein BDV38DRAFT_261414 [Aspergillus pseudotamarii]KAE8132343.1 hypothetical protein BDV38DRAFT_261414 [Aspergillus pseudotamarii]